LAVRAVLAELPPAGHAMTFDGWLPSGANVATWRAKPFTASRLLRASAGIATLPRGNTPSVQQLEQAWAQLPEPVRRERLARAAARLAVIGEAPVIEVPYCVWQMGSMLLVAQPCEAYSWFQQQLRRRFGGVVVLNLAYGFSYGYLPVDRMYDRPANYQVSQSCFARGSLERLARTVTDHIDGHLRPPNGEER
jgi:hypothetical protein